jgi:predicted dehydrogenase
VVAVHADLRTVRAGAGAEDEIELHLRHAAGVRSTLAAGMASAAPGPRFQVNGDQGGFVIDGFDVQEEQLKDGESPASLGEQWGVEPESAWGRLYTADGSRRVPSERGAWNTYYPAVARAVAGHAPPPVDPHDAVATAVVLDAARMSAASDTVVSLV